MEKVIVSQETIHIVPEDGSEPFDVVEVEYGFQVEFPFEDLDEKEDENQDAK